MRKIITLLLFLFSYSLYADEASSINIEPNTSEFVIKLAANPTTGFQWTLTKYDKSLLRLKSSIYNAKQTKLVGAGGEMVFIFEIVKVKSYPNSSEILFKYARSWEPKSGTVKKVVVNFPRK